MNCRDFTPAFLIALALGCATAKPREAAASPKQQVADTERAFAHTMAARDHDAFSSFISEEAVFLSAPGPLRGRKQVAGAWKRYFEGTEAPFSWEPDQVEVLDSGDLAMSTGPVRDARGERIATFTSIWRREAPGVWRIVFDKGDKVCPEPPAPGQ